MAYEIPGFSFTLPAGEDFRPATAKGQYRFVNINGDGNAVRPAASGVAIGVRQNYPSAGEGTTIVQSGIVLVEAGGTFAVGDAVGTDAEGRAIAAGAGTALGRAIHAGTSGVISTVLLIPAAVAAV